MRPLAEQDVEAELSYAYLHAVTAHANMACQVTSRPLDNSGVDAFVTAWGPFQGAPDRMEVDMKVQLKATVGVLRPVDGKLSYFFRGAQRYADLASTSIAVPRILVVLCLPTARNEWLAIDGDMLVLRRCAYWVSLRGAPASTNTSGQTVKIPPSQILTPDAFRELAGFVARNEVPQYDAS
jgi:hypothetical protein